MFNIVKIFTSKPVKIARESLTIEESPPAPEGRHQLTRFVGSIRRRVQRHASSSGTADQPSSGQAAGESLSRKNSLTQNLFKKDEKKQTITKQKSIGDKTDLFKALTFKDKSKSSVSVKHDSLAAPKGDLQKGVRKSDKKDSDRSLKSSLSKSKTSAQKQKSKEDKGGTSVKQDDFLKATMRIFLVVSPPVGKLQVMTNCAFLTFF